MLDFDDHFLKPAAEASSLASFFFPATDRVFFAVKSTLDVGREGNGQGGGEESCAGQVELVKKSGLTVCCML